MKTPSLLATASLLGAGMADELARADRGGALKTVLGNMVLLVPLSAVLGALAAWIHLITDERDVPLWRGFMVGPAFLLSFSVGFIPYEGVLEKASTGGAVPMLIGGLIFIVLSMALLERSFVETAIFLFWWLLGSVFLLGLLGAIWRLFT